MNREVRIAIVGIILGILSTIATEEMRCIFLPFASTCLMCDKKLSVFAIVCILYLILCFIEPADSSASLNFCIFMLALLTATLVFFIYEFEKCL